MVKHAFRDVNRTTNALAGQGRAQDPNFVMFSSSLAAVLGLCVLNNSAVTSSRLVSLP